MYIVVLQKVRNNTLIEIPILGGKDKEKLLEVIHNRDFISTYFPQPALLTMRDGFVIEPVH